MVTVVRLPFVPTEETRALPDSEYSQTERQMRQEAETTLSAAAAHFQAGKGAEVTSEILIGEAAEVILEEAERWHADLIAVGSHGYRGWKRFLLGSVSEQIVRNAECSVMILRPRKMQFAAAD
ncbi:MAG: universal stress protein [Acidobacteriota bacterium]|nr:universal stress protein [Acidobacteriota bacterium]